MDDFINGSTIDELVEKFNFSKLTITRNIKKNVNSEQFIFLQKQNNSKKNNSINLKNFKKNFNENKLIDDHENDIKNSENYFNDNPRNESYPESTFMEIAPLNYDINNENRKDLSSVPISEIALPKIVYMIVDDKIELKTKFLRDYPDWHFLSENDLNRKTIEIYFDIKIAKRFCNKNQKVIKVPNPNVFKIAAPLLISRGISRIVSPDKLIAL